MSVITHDIHGFFEQKVNGNWYVNTRAIKNRAQAAEVNAQCISDARMERLKALGCVVLGSGTTLALTGAAYFAGIIASLVVGVFAYPLSIIPPLYNLVTLLSGVTVGGAAGYITVKKCVKGFFIDAERHWENSNHLYAQALATRMHQTTLSK